MLDSILNILPITLFFLIGITIKKLNMIAQLSISDIKKIVANITLPALLFIGFSQISLKKEYLLIVIIMFCTPTIMLLLGKVLNRSLKINNKYFPFLLSGFESGMLGYALFLAFFGIENLPAIALVDLGQGLFVFFILVPTLNSLDSKATSIKTVALSIIKSPVIIAILSGLLVGGIGIKFDVNILLSSIFDFINIVGGLTMPLIMISLGFEIEFKKAGLARAIKTVLIRKILLVSIALVLNKFLIVSLLNLPQIYEYALLTIFLMPPPFVISIFMDQKDRESVGYVTNTLSISIILSVLILLIMIH